MHPNAESSLARHVALGLWKKMKRPIVLGFLSFLPACAQIVIGPGALPTGQVNTAYSQKLTATGGTGPYTFDLSSGSLPPGSPAFAVSSAGVISGTPDGCASFVANPSRPCADATEPMNSTFTVLATDSKGATGTQTYTIGIYWNPTEASFLTTFAGYDANMLVGVSNPPPLLLGGHLEPANPLFRQPATDNQRAWNAWVDGIHAAGATILNIEPDLDCLFNNIASCLALYGGAIDHAHALGMSVALDPEFSPWPSCGGAGCSPLGPSTGYFADCQALIGHAMNATPGMGVSDWYACVTTPIPALGMSAYQWMISNWLVNGDRFVPVHEPTTMTARWGEGIDSAGCSTAAQPAQQGANCDARAVSAPGRSGNTCANDWWTNFLQPLMNPTTGLIPAWIASAGVAIRTGVTTIRPETTYTALFASNLPISVDMGIDTYSFTPADLSADESAISLAQQNQHQIFFEEFGPQDWIEVGAPYGETCAIKGCYSCDWQATQSYQNFLGAFLPFAASKGALSVSLFPTQILAGCSASYPDNCDNLAALAAANANFLAGNSSAVSQKLASLMAPNGSEPAAITKTAGDGQSTPVAQAFPTALAVAVAGSAGAPVAGASVTFTVAPGATGASGVFSGSGPVIIVTDQNGNATAPLLTANGVPGQFTVTATVNALTAAFTLANLGYTLGASSVIVGSAAGSGTVLLSGYGPWTATSSVPWLQLASGSSSGSAGGPIQFSYQANTNPAVQTGTLTIAGLPFTVTQAGSSYVPIYPVATLAAPGLNLPQAVAVDAQGNVYIADTGNNAIEQWNAATGQITALVSSELNAPAGVAVDAQGNVYIADTANNAVKEWTAATQQVSTLVSSGLSAPTGLAVDALANVYIADAGNHAVKEWNAASQQVSVLVGSGIDTPAAVAVDALGNVYIADSANNAVLEWSPSSGQTATLVSGLSGPTGVAVDGQGNVYIADTGNNALKQWSSATQQVTALISSGLNSPAGLAVEGCGNVYLADTAHSAVKKLRFAYLALGSAAAESAAAGTDSVAASVLPPGTRLSATSDEPWLTTAGIAGATLNFSFAANDAVLGRTGHITAWGPTVTVTQSGDAPGTMTKTAGDGQTTSLGQAFATAPQVNVTDAYGLPVQGAAVTFSVTPGASGASGTFASTPPMPIVTDQNGNAAAPALTANSVAGTFTVTAALGGLNATFTLNNLAYILGTSSLTVGSAAGSATVLLSGYGPWTATSNSSWLHLAAGSASGTGGAPIQFSYDANTNPNAQAGSLTIAGLTFTVIQAGTSYIGPGPVTTLVPGGFLPLGVAVDGSGNVYFADGLTNAIFEWSASTQQVAALVSAGLTSPFGVAVDGSGNVYVADVSANAIFEWIASTQQLTMLVSTGLSAPHGVAVDTSGNVYIADAGNNAIKEWQASTQQVTTLASAGLNGPVAVAVDGSGNVYFTDTGNNAIDEWNVSTQQVATLVSAGLSAPQAVAVDGSGNVYFADTGNGAVDEWNASTQQLATLVSSGLSAPQGVAVDSFGNVYIGDSNNNAVKEIPFAFVGPATLSESPSAGSDALLPVLPATVSLVGIFAPASDQGWLTIGTVVNGIVNFSFTANTSTSARTAHIILLGQQVTVTQNGLVTQTIAFAPLSNQAFGAAPLTLGGTASSGLAVSFASTTPAVCTVSGAAVTLVAAGTCTIQATQAGNAAYAAAAPVNQSFQVTQESQTIAFGTLSNQVFGAAPFTVSATASSGLAVSFVAATPAVCTVSGATVTIIAAGTCTIQATQPGNTNFAAAAPVNQSSQVTPASQTITFPPLASQSFGITPFTVAATASSGLAVSFVATTPAVCTVSGATVTLVAVGTCAIQATQPGNTNYATATPVSQSFTVTQGSQTIAFGVLANQPYGTPPFTIGATASSGLAVSFASTTSTVCTVSGATVTLAAAGTCTIQATQPGNTNYAAATAVNQSFQVTQESQTIVFGALSNQSFGAAPFTVAATASSGLAVSFASVTPAVCTVSGATVTLAGAGACTIQATQPGNSNYTAATAVNQSFQVTQEGQTIMFTALSNRVFGAAPFTVAATASSGLAVSFASAIPAVCTVSGATVTLAGAGTCTIQAAQPGNTNYAAATPVNQSFQVTQASQTITFAALSAQVFGAAPFTVAATASSGLAVSFASTTSTICTVAGATVTLAGVGTCAIQASQPGNIDYAAATPVSRSFKVTQGSQTIDFAALSNQSFGTLPFTVVATASSGLTVSFASTTSTICTVSGATVTLVALGTCTIHATQAGNADYAAATAVSQSFQVLQGSQTITFGALSNQTFGAAPFTVSATASSGLTVRFNSQTTSVCTVSTVTVTMVAPGACTIQATQAGNTDYAAATPVNQSFQIAQKSQTITFGALSNRTFGGAAFTVSATASSGLAVSFASTTPAVCTVSAKTVTLAGAGTCTIQATQAGNTDYAAAAPVEQSFQVAQESQTITFAALSAQTLGTPPFTVAATASSGLTVSFASTTSTICTVSGATVTLVAAGTCTIQAMQAGNTNYAAAPPVSRSFQVAKAK